jgi:methyl-accepting chemotaxis protein
MERNIMSMTIGKRVGFGFVAVIVTTAALGAFFYTQLHKIASTSLQVTAEELPGIRDSLKVEYCMTRNYARVWRHILVPDEKGKQQIDIDMKATGEQQTTLMKQIEQSITAAEERQLLDGINAPRDRYHEVRQQVFDLSRQNKTAEATALASTQLLPAFDQYQQAVHRLVEHNDKTSSSSAADITAAIRTGNIGTIIGCAIALVAGVTIAWGIIRSTNKVLNRLATTLGDGSGQVASAAGQVSSSSQSLAQGASEQAAALEETTSSLEEMSSMTKKNAETAQQASSLSSEAKKAADKGNQAMQKMGTAIDEIQKSASETAKIIKVIDEIAFQTNLLALNAAVEAARAGEAGKGFAVVAEEVRNLAMRSAEAAKNTASMIEGSVNNAKNGVAISTEVARILQEITGAAGKVNTLLGEISAASSEQAQGIDQVNKAVGQMDKVTQSNAANAEESASASEELSAQAAQLNGVVNELIAMVRGTRSVESGESIAQVRSTTAKSRRAPAASTTKVPAAFKSSHAIPLDSNETRAVDLSEFSKAA